MPTFWECPALSPMNKFQDIIQVTPSLILETNTEHLHMWIRENLFLHKLEQLERLRSETGPHHLMITHTIESYWSQKNNRSRTENVRERTRFSKSRSNDLEDISQGQRSSHATHLLMLVIICTKYWKNPPRTVDVTEWTRFSRSRLNDLEDIGQCQRSSHATHLLVLVIICTKYGKNPPRTVDATERTWFTSSRPNDLEDIGQGQRSLHATHPLMLVIICAKYGKNPSRIVDFFQGQARKV